MEFFTYFFRGEPDGYVFKNFSLAHIIILIIALIGCILINRYKDQIKRNNKLSNSIKYSIIVALLSQQIILYIWYIVTDYNLLHEGLPLYNCRIAIISLAVGLLIGNKFLKELACYWGVFGAIFALLAPGVDPFSFPHYTGVSYFVGHLFLAWGVTYTFNIQGFKYTKTNLKRVLIFTNIYHSVIFIFDMMIGANYCYLRETPIGIGGDLPQLAYTFILFMIYNLAICLSYFFIKKLSEEETEEEEVVATV